MVYSACAYVVDHQKTKFRARKLDGMAEREKFEPAGPALRYL